MQSDGQYKRLYISLRIQKKEHMKIARVFGGTLFRKFVFVVSKHALLDFADYRYFSMKSFFLLSLAPWASMMSMC